MPVLDDIDTTKEAGAKRWYHSCLMISVLTILWVCVTVWEWTSLPMPELLTMASAAKTGRGPLLTCPSWPLTTHLVKGQNCDCGVDSAADTDFFFFFLREREKEREREREWEKVVIKNSCLQKNQPSIYTLTLKQEFCFNLCVLMYNLLLQVLWSVLNTAGLEETRALPGRYFSPCGKSSWRPGPGSRGSSPVPSAWPACPSGLPPPPPLHLQQGTGPHFHPHSPPPPSLSSCGDFWAVAKLLVWVLAPALVSWASLRVASFCEVFWLAVWNNWLNRIIRRIVSRVSKQKQFLCNMTIQTKSRNVHESILRKVTNSFTPVPIVTGIRSPPTSLARQRDQVSRITVLTWASSLSSPTALRSLWQWEIRQLAHHLLLFLFPVYTHIHESEAWILKRILLLLCAEDNSFSSFQLIVIFDKFSSSFDIISLSIILLWWIVNFFFCYNKVWQSITFPCTTGAIHT